MALQRWQHCQIMVNLMFSKAGQGKYQDSSGRCIWGRGWGSTGLQQHWSRWWGDRFAWIHLSLPEHIILRANRQSSLNVCPCEELWINVADWSNPDHESALQANSSYWRCSECVHATHSGTCSTQCRKESQGGIQPSVEGLCEMNLSGKLLAITGELAPDVQLSFQEHWYYWKYMTSRRMKYFIFMGQDKALDTKPTKVPEGREFSRKRLEPTINKATWITTQQHLRKDVTFCLWCQYQHSWFTMQWTQRSMWWWYTKYWCNSTLSNSLTPLRRPMSSCKLS